MQIHSIGIDLGKTTFHLVALGAAGKVLVKKKFTQKQLLTYTANLQTSLIGLEACAGAHFLGQALRKQGHDVRLIPGQFVKPFVKSNKNDFVDAEAIAEAVERKNMRFVPIKTDDQLDLQAIHRVRDRLVSRRTAVINQIRAFLLERGLVFAKRPAQLKAAMADVLESAEADLTPMMRNLIDTLWGEWKTVEVAPAAVLRVKRDKAPFGAWLDRLDSRAHTNVVVVAMANKLARIAWAVLSSGNDYRSAVPA